MTEPLTEPGSTRSSHLSEMIDELRSRMLSTDSDQNYALMARVRRELLAELADLSASTAPAQETRLNDFEKRLRERESGAKAARRTKGR